MPRWPKKDEESDILSSGTDNGVVDMDNLQQAWTAISTNEPIAAPYMLNIEHLHPRIRKIIEHLLANQNVIITYNTGSFEAHWRQEVSPPDAEVMVKAHIHVYPR